MLFNSHLSSIITDSKSFLPPQWKEKYSSFLEAEHWDCFVSKMVKYVQTETSFVAFSPEFIEEIRIPEEQILNYFQPVISLSREGYNENLSRKWAESIENTPFEFLLIILGQRFTSASLRDEKAIPPLKTTLMESCFVPFNPQISKATREWEKHVGRQENSFWGTTKGNPKEKEEKVRRLILDMLKTKTWWNVFYHYKHGLVYEMRVASGQGIRWNQSGTKLIGFLEHFLDSEVE
jgi:hypothetical protein